MDISGLKEPPTPPQPTRTAIFSTYMIRNSSMSFALVLPVSTDYWYACVIICSGPALEGHASPASLWHFIRDVLSNPHLIAIIGGIFYLDVSQSPSKHAQNARRAVSGRVSKARPRSASTVGGHMHRRDESAPPPCLHLRAVSVSARFRRDRLKGARRADERQRGREKDGG